MKIFFDTEFIEDGKTIDLISIGMVREDGERFYAENVECDFSRADPWVEKNVFPHLAGVKSTSAVTRAQIRDEIFIFAGKKPEFWAYYADYDWVVLCQLFGRMVDLPNEWPKFCMDLKQLCVQKGNPKLPKPLGAHNALVDAVWASEMYKMLNAMEG